MCIRDRYYLYQSYFLKRVESGHDTDEHLLAMKNNIHKVEPRNKDYIVLSAIPEDIDMIEEYITTLLPTINQEWARDYLENLINTNQESINEINQAIEQANHLTGASTLGEPLKEFAFGAQTYISDESDAVVFLKNLLNEFQGKAIIVDL